MWWAEQWSLLQLRPIHWSTRPTYFPAKTQQEKAKKKKEKRVCGKIEIEAKAVLVRRESAPEPEHWRERKRSNSNSFGEENPCTTLPLFYPNDMDIFYGVCYLGKLWRLWDGKLRIIFYEINGKNIESKNGY